MSADHKTLRGSVRGFTLIEVLIAFTILALGLVAAMESFSTGLTSLGTLGDYRLASMQARSKLEEVGITIPLEPGEVSGEFDEGNRWLVTVTPYEREPMPAIEDFSGNLYEVRVEISWGDQRAYALETLRFAGEQP